MWRPLEPLVYFGAITAFWLVALGAARMRHDVLLVACIPPVFVAFIMGFSLGIYAWDAFGALPVAAAPVLAWVCARPLARRYPPRDLLIAIWLIWAVGLAFALVAVNFPDAA